MFNDERINAECGKIYSRGILLAVLLTLVYAALRTHPCNGGAQIPQGRR